MGAVGVVRPQDLAHEDEEIVEPARGKRRFNGCGSVPFAKLVVQYVGMRDILTSVGVRRYLGVDVIGMALANPQPIQHDSEGSQINAFEDDGAGQDAGRLTAQIERNLFELLCQGE